MKFFLIVFIFLSYSVFAQEIPCYKTFFQSRLFLFESQIEEKITTVLLLKHNHFIETQNFDLKLDFVKKIEHIEGVFDHKIYVSEYGGICVPRTSEGQILDVFIDYLINDLFFDKLLEGKATNFTFYTSKKN